MEVSKEIIKKIVDELCSDFKVFVNKNTFEVVSFPDEDKGFDLDPIWQGKIDKVKNNIKAFIEIEQPSSRESYEIMQNFIFTIKNKITSNKLTQAITGRKPFANFNHQIHQLESERAKWFEFKDNQLTEYVKNQLKVQGL